MVHARRFRSLFTSLESLRQKTLRKGRGRFQFLDLQPNFLQYFYRHENPYSHKNLKLSFSGFRNKQYSETSLKRTLGGQKLLSALERCPLWRGCAMKVPLRIGPDGTNDAVRFREVSALEDVRFREVSL